GLDSESVTASEATPGLRRELFAVQGVAAARAVFTAGGAARRVPAALGYQREAHLGERLELADHTVPAVVRARPARAAADRVLDCAQRELALERLDRRVEGVAHRHVNGSRPI